jgi:prepilin signal peptidase PulO-like enzyme (type II secretory pathway)
VLTFAAFYLAADVWKWKIPHLALLGMNPLVIYILQQILIAFYGDALPKNASWWLALLGFATVYGICYLIARYLYHNKYFIRI